MKRLFPSVFAVGAISWDARVVSLPPQRGDQDTACQRLEKLWMEADARMFDSIASMEAPGSSESPSNGASGVRALSPHGLDVLFCEENGMASGGPWKADFTSEIKKGGASLLVFGAQNMDPGARADLQSRCVTGAVHFEWLEPEEVLGALAREFGVKRVAVRWGSRLGEALVKRGVLNELQLILSPEVIGCGRDVPPTGFGSSAETGSNEGNSGGFTADGARRTGRVSSGTILREGLSASVDASLVKMETIDDKCLTFWKLSYRSDCSEKVDSAGSGA